MSSQRLVSAATVGATPVPLSGRLGVPGILLAGVFAAAAFVPAVAGTSDDPAVFEADETPAADQADRPPPAAPRDLRVALVIGNANFQHASALQNPLHDAADVATRLRNLGFEVVERHDLTTREIGPTLREFRSHAEHASIGLVFIAGHGLQVNGENYFPAVDADINGEDDVPTQSLSMNQLLDLLAEAKTRLNVLLLDACRNNPFALGTRSGTRGLAPVNAPSGTVISYATRPGSVAGDGKGHNGLYTGELLRQMMDVPDLPIELVFKRIVAGVKQSSNGRQEPWWEGSMEGNFCFGTCRDEPATASPAAVAAIARPVPVPVRQPKAVPRKLEPAPQPAPPAPPLPVTTTVAVTFKDLGPLLFNRTMTRTETGRIYRLEGGQAWQAYARTLAGNGGISSLAESPGGELYACDASEGRILRFGDAPEHVAYQHTGPIRHLAFGPAGHLFFSSATGLHSGGTIFELADSKALPYRIVKPEDLPQGWAGTFAFDRSGMLWLSSGNTHPAGLYRVRGAQLEPVYTAPAGGVLGFSFLQDGSIVYADGAHSVFRVTLPGAYMEKLFESPFEGTLTDVKTARPATVPNAGG